MHKARENLCNTPGKGMKYSWKTPGMLFPNICRNRAEVMVWFCLLVAHNGLHCDDESLIHNSRIAMCLSSCVFVGSQYSIIQPKCQCCVVCKDRSL